MNANWGRWFITWVGSWLLLTQGWMVVLWIWGHLPLGMVPTPTRLLIVMGIMLAINAGIYVLVWFLSRLPGIGRLIAPRRQFRVLLLNTLVGSVVLWQMGNALMLAGFYLITVTVLGLLTIILPGWLRRDVMDEASVLDYFREIYRRRGLIRLWIGYRIEARYTQTILGIMWIILLPLTIALIMAFAFSQFLGSSTINDTVPFVAFLLTGIIMYSFFSDVILKSKESILNMVGIINRVYFPREVVVILLVGEGLVDLLFQFTATIVVNILFFNIFPNAHYIYLLLPMTALFCLTTGLALVFSWLTLVVRDLQQLLAVITQLLFYTTVLYWPENAAQPYRYIMSLNPLTSLVVGLRDVMLFNRAPDFNDMYMAMVISTVVLYVGYIYFKVNEDRFVESI